MLLTVIAEQKFCDNDPNAFASITQSALYRADIRPDNVTSVEATDGQEKLLRINGGADSSKILSAFSESFQAYRDGLPIGTPNKHKPGVGVSMSEDVSEELTNVRISIGFAPPCAD